MDIDWNVIEIEELRTKLAQQCKVNDALVKAYTKAKQMYKLYNVKRNKGSASVGVRP